MKTISISLPDEVADRYLSEMPSSELMLQAAASRFLESREERMRRWQELRERTNAELAANGVTIAETEQMIQELYDED